MRACCITPKEDVDYRENTMGANMNPNDILQEYDKQHDVYDSFTLAMKALLLDLLQRYHIRVLSVTSRLKKRESLGSKLAIVGRNYKNLEDVTDICGLRIITYYPDEINSVSSLISNEFNVDSKNSVDKRSLIAADRFGYLSVHYVVKLSDDRLLLTENRRFSNCKAEIQVRSILQHAWAEIEHDLEYKTEKPVSREIRRSFSRLAGLLELADDEFVRIRNVVSSEENKITQELIDSPEKVQLDPSCLLIYLKSSKLVYGVNKKIEQATHTILSKSDPDFLKDLVKRLRYLDFRTLADIDMALGAHQKQVVNIAKRLLEPVETSEVVFDSISLYYLCYAVLSSEHSIEHIRTFSKRFNAKGTKGNDTVRFILNCKKL